MEFKRYQHVQRIGTSSVEGLLKGKCYITPKIDGTNASIWLGEDGEVHCGSRKRDLTIGDDNAGFREWVNKHPNFKEYLVAHPTHRLYGEWLVPHTIKQYVDYAWRNFYVFDVTKDTGKIDNNGDPIEKYLPYEDYFWRLQAHNILYLEPLAIIENPTIKELKEIMENNTFLMKEGEIGEGIVIKNYDFVNKYGRIVWGKMVRAEFIKKNGGNPKTIKDKEGYGETEISIVNTYITEALIDKEKAKIELEKGGWESKYIRQLLGTVYHCLIEEEMWNILKKYKNPTINFKQLQALTIAKIKELKEDLFC